MDKEKRKEGREKDVRMQEYRDTKCQNHSGIFEEQYIMRPVQYGRQQKGAGRQECGAESRSGFSVFPQLPSFFLKFILMCLCVLSSGCSTVKKIQHLPQLLTLKRYSESQENLAHEIDRQDRLFEQMREEVQSGVFSSYQTVRAIRKRFGEPVFIRPTVYHDADARQWLYRRAKDFNGPRIYIYADLNGRVIAVESLPGAGEGE